MVMVQKSIISDQFDVRRICVEVLHRKEDQYKIKTTATRNLAKAIPVTLLTYIFKVPGSNISNDLSEVCRDFCSLSWYTAMH
jgi:hypothetical protein